MFDWEKIFAQVAAVKAAPLPFLVAVLAIAVLIGWANDRYYSGMLANKDSEIALYKGERDDYKDKLNGASPDQAKKGLDELRGELAALAKHFASRSMTADQERTLKQSASISGETKPAVHIVGDVACTDCSIYGGEFVRVLNDAGWVAITGIVMGPNRHPESGLGISLINSKNPTPAESNLVHALRAANIPFSLLDDTGHETIILITTPAPH